MSQEGNNQQPIVQEQQPVAQEQPQVSGNGGQAVVVNVQGAPGLFDCGQSK